MPNFMMLHKKSNTTCWASSILRSTVTHHSVGECVAGLGHWQTLDDLWSHPGKRAHQRHVRRVGQEPGRSEITDLERG